MLLHADGFDWVPTAADSALLADRYDLVDANVVIDDSAANVDWLNGVTASSGSDQRLRPRTFSAHQTNISGFHLNALSLSARTIYRWLLGGVVQGVIRITADGRIEAYSGDGITLLEQSAAGVITAATRHWIEAKYHTSPNADVGFVVIGVDDVEAVSVRAITQIAGSASIDQVELVLDANTVIDDWLVKDTAGTTHNDYGGEAYVELTQITDEVEYGYQGGSEAPFEWTNSVGDMFDNNTYINEVPTTVPDDDTTYVRDNGAAGDIDTYRGEFALLESTLSITIPLSAVGVLYYARIEAPGSEDFNPHQFQPSSNERVSGSVISVDSTSYAYHQAIHVTDPDGAAWTVDAYETSEFGMESA